MFSASVLGFCSGLSRLVFGSSLGEASLGEASPSYREVGLLLFFFLAFAGGFFPGFLGGFLCFLGFLVFFLGFLGFLAIFLGFLGFLGGFLGFLVFL